jgi:hypothetical protein
MDCNVGVYFGAQEGVATIARRRVLLNVRRFQELEMFRPQSHASHSHR